MSLCEYFEEFYGNELPYDFSVAELSHPLHRVNKSYEISPSTPKKATTRLPPIVVEISQAGHVSYDGAFNVGKTIYVSKCLKCIRINVKKGISLCLKKTRSFLEQKWSANPIEMVLGNFFWKKSNGSF
jgi:hypothetical protein